MDASDTPDAWDVMRREVTAVVGDPVDKAATLASVRKRLLDRGAKSAPTLSRHILLRRLGSGGAGVVYEAFDPELERKVAIKLLKTSAFEDASQGAARLKREGQAMARLSHPNVIAVYDVGSYRSSDLAAMVSAQTADAAPDESPADGVFVVMELVDGSNLRAWMQGEASWRTRLEIMVQAGRGLAHAHAQGLVHRDFKPDNVLVGSDGVGSTPRVRVLDFGLARAADTKGTRSPDGAPARPEMAGDLHSPLTRPGIVPGTPAYMSPEQHAGADADARSDQYNYCVTLFEVLAGQRPFPSAPLQTLVDLKHKGEFRDPPRDTEVPDRIWRAIRRGLSPNPEQRFPSMDALLRELERRPGAWLRWAVPVVGFVGMLGAWLGRDGPEALCDVATETIERSWSSAVREDLRGRMDAVLGAQAQTVWTKAHRRIDAYVDAWKRARASACSLGLSGASAQDVRAMEAKIVCLERRRADLETALDVLLREDDAIVRETLSILDGLQSLDACDDPNAMVEALPPPGPQRIEAMEIPSEITRARTLAIAGKHARRAAIIEDAVRRARRIGHAPTLARALLALGTTRWDEDRLDEALAAMHEALLLAEQHDDEGTAVEAILVQAGLLGKSKQQYEVALRMLEWVQARSEDPEVRIRADRYRGMFYTLQARPEEAVQVLEGALAFAEQALDAESLLLESLLSPLANAYRQLERHDDALATYERALALRRRVLGEGPGDAMIHNNIGGVLSELGRTDEACARYRRAHDMFLETYGEEHSRVAMTLNNLGNCRASKGDHEGALRIHRRSLAIKERTLGEDHPDCGYSHVNVGDALLALGWPDEALQAYTRGLEVWRASMGDAHPMLAVAMAGLADAETMRGDPERAEAWIEAGLALLPDDRMGSVRARLLSTRARARKNGELDGEVAAARSVRASVGIDEDPSTR